MNVQYYVCTYYIHVLQSHVFFFVIVFLFLIHFLYLVYFFTNPVAQSMPHHVGPSDLLRIQMQTANSMA